jgi:hypothetical protein
LAAQIQVGAAVVQAFAAVAIVALTVVLLATARM